MTFWIMFEVQDHKDYTKFARSFPIIPQIGDLVEDNLLGCIFEVKSIKWIIKDLSHKATPVCQLSFISKIEGGKNE